MMPNGILVYSATKYTGRSNFTLRKKAHGIVIPYMNVSNTTQVGKSVRFDLFCFLAVHLPTAQVTPEQVTGGNPGTLCFT